MIIYWVGGWGEVNSDVSGVGMAVAGAVAADVGSKLRVVGDGTMGGSIVVGGSRAGCNCHAVVGTAGDAGGGEDVVAAVVDSDNSVGGIALKGHSRRAGLAWALPGISCDSPPGLDAP